MTRKSSIVPSNCTVLFSNLGTSAAILELKTNYVRNSGQVTADNALKIMGVTLVYE